MYRVTETPNAVMTTYASPTQGSAELSLWKVEMKEGAQGPLHVFDSEQIWTALSGTASVELGDEKLELTAGSTAVFPAGVTRRITADQDFTAVVAGYGAATVTVPGESTDRGTPPWIS
ncbi:cupin domain [Kribbella sp. VKM Ac-2527]|uniref:Cupin domain n=1 Tax=Kribbella caucasensis TaxID=2512215 RepID=A0A4R6KJ77_9ACTN|nr:cupin domain-containing protein [Kribbella sp. VKM Ac-2527]TDO50797.1 cupin domain [Kribbella sp. VKM Ac-2527]